MNGRIRSRLITLVEKLDDRRKDCAEFVLGPDARRRTSEALVDECVDVNALPSLVAIGIQLSGGHPAWRKLQIDLEPRYRSEARLKQRDLVRTHMIQRYAPAVCRVELDGEKLGSGFLIGPHQVITNYHVARVALRQSGTGTPVFTKALRFRFDTSRDDIHDDDGTVLSVEPGQSVLAHSIDGGDGLDYVVAELAAGTQHKDLSNASIPPVHFSFDGDFTATKRYAFIIQHPEGQASRIDQGVVTSRFLLNASHRLLYNIDTDYGSSGSPVILLDGTLLALHCARGQHYEQSNVGIFFPRILTDIQSKNPELLASRIRSAHPSQTLPTGLPRIQTGVSDDDRSLDTSGDTNREVPFSVQSGQDLITHLRSLPNDRLPMILRDFAQARVSSVFKVWRLGNAFEIECSPRLVDNDRRTWLHEPDQRFTLRPQESCSWCPRQPTLPPFFRIDNSHSDNSQHLVISRKRNDDIETLRVVVE